MRRLLLFPALHLPLRHLRPASFERCRRPLRIIGRNQSALVPRSFTILPPTASSIRILRPQAPRHCRGPRRPRLPQGPISPTPPLSVRQLQQEEPRLCPWPLATSLLAASLPIARR